MTSSSMDDPKGRSVRGWFQRSRRVLAVVAAGLIAVAALLLWGPVGFGNGPLTAAEGSTVGGSDPGGGPVGFVIPFRNPGDAPAVVDGLDLIGGSRYRHYSASDPFVLAVCANSGQVKPAMTAAEAAS